MQQQHSRKYGGAGGGGGGGGVVQSASGSGSGFAAAGMAQGPEAPVLAAAASVLAAFKAGDAATLASEELTRLCDAVVPYPADTRRCRDAITRVRTLFETWTRTWLMKACGKTSEEADTQGAVFAFVSGSYRLNVYSEAADVDIVLVTTAAITRKAVFTDFVRLLAKQSDVSQLQVLADIRVPLISAVIDDQDLDIMTVHLCTTSLPQKAPDLLVDYEWMNGLDDASVLCLCGPRVTELLLHHYCTPHNAGRLMPGAFCTAVRYLRLWARQRGVYGNKHGYFGGVNIALLVGWAADVLYHVATDDPLGAPPLLTAAHLVVCVLRALAVKSPASPLVLFRCAAIAGTARPCPVWLQRLDSDPAVPDACPMHLFTPCFPRTNTVFAATRHTVRVIQGEIQRCDSFLNVGAWASMVAPLAQDMVSSVRQWLQIVIRAPDTPRGRLWQGYIEAQIRHLVFFLSTEELAIDRFRALPTWVPLSDGGGGDGDGDGKLKLQWRQVAMCIAANPDNITRMYTIRGSIPRALAFFLNTFVDAPTVSCHRPPGATLSVQGPVLSQDMPPEMLAGLVRPCCRQSELDAFIAVEHQRHQQHQQQVAAEERQQKPATTKAAAGGARDRAGWRQLGCLLPFDKHHHHDCAAACPAAAAAPATFTRRAWPRAVPPVAVFSMAHSWKRCEDLAGAGTAGLLAAPVRAVRVLRRLGQWSVPCDLYVGPPVVLRVGTATARWTVPLVCGIAELSPPPLPPSHRAQDQKKEEQEGLLEYKHSLYHVLTANNRRLLNLVAGKTLGCWCTEVTRCHAHAIATVANELLLAPALDKPCRIRARRHRRRRYIKKPESTNT